MTLGDSEIVYVKVRSSTREREFLYLVSAVPCDFAQHGFLMRRLTGGETYQVVVDSDPRKCACDCLGFLRFGRCRHLFKCIELAAKERR